MRWIVFLCAALLLVPGATLLSGADEPKVDPKAKQLKVQGKFTEIIVTGDDKSETATRIPAFFTLEGKKSVFRSGGAVGIVGNAVIGAPPVTPFGFSLQLTVARLGGDDLLLEMTVENTQVSLDTKMTSAKTASLASARKAKLGKQLRIVLEEDARGAPRQWLELTIAEVDE